MSTAIPTTLPARVIELLNNGKAVLLGEWRGFTPETIKYVSKTSGKPAEFGRVNHVIEVVDGERVESLKVSQSVPDGQDPAKVAVAFKRGQRVAVEVDQIIVEKGNKSIRALALHSVG